MENWHINLQMFAEEPAGNDNDGAGANNQDGAAGADGAGNAGNNNSMSFDDMLRAGHQSEFDRRVNKAIETAKSKFVDPRVAQLENQLQSYQRRDAVAAAGVASEFADFVAYQVAGSMGEGEKFDDKLKSYVEANPQYKKGMASGWGAPQNGGTGRQLSGVEAAFAALNPNIKFD